MMSPFLEPALLCLAAALSWNRFISIFSSDINEAKLRSPLTTIATSTFLVSAGLLISKAGAIMALSSIVSDLFN